MSDIKMRATAQGSVTEVKMLLSHPMETGRRKDKTSGALIPAWYIDHIEVQHNGRPLLRADWGTGVSKDPYLSLRFAGGKAGDKIGVSWTDNKGGQFSGETTIV